MKCCERKCGGSLCLVGLVFGLLSSDSSSPLEVSQPGSYTSVYPQTQGKCAKSNMQNRFHVMRYYVISTFKTVEKGELCSLK